MTPALAASILAALAAARAEIKRLGKCPDITSCYEDPTPRMQYESAVHDAICSRLASITPPLGATITDATAHFTTGRIPTIAATFRLSADYLSITIKATDTTEAVCAAWDRLIMERITTKEEGHRALLAHLNSLLTTPKATP